LLNPPATNCEPKRQHSRKEAEPASELPFCPALPMGNPIEDKGKTREGNREMHRDWVKH